MAKIKRITAEFGAELRMVGAEWIEENPEMLGEAQSAAQELAECDDSIPRSLRSEAADWIYTGMMTRARELDLFPKLRVVGVK